MQQQQQSTISSFSTWTPVAVLATAVLAHVLMYHHHKKKKTSPRIYLDYNATTPLDKKVLDLRHVSFDFQHQASSTIALVFEDLCFN